MATSSDNARSERSRARLLSLAGIVIIAIGVGAFLLPAAGGIPGTLAISVAMLAAGIVELLAGSMRRGVRPYAMAAGAVTAVAGLLFLLNPTVHFFPTVTLVLAWLIVRSLILAYASQHSSGGVRTWMRLSAGMDFLLALLLVAGLSIASLIVSLFGPTAPLIASFSWVLAASFAVTGTLLLEVASWARDGGT